MTVSIATQTSPQPKPLTPNSNVDHNLSPNNLIIFEDLESNRKNGLHGAQLSPTPVVDITANKDGDKITIASLIPTYKESADAINKSLKSLIMNTGSYFSLYL